MKPEQVDAFLDQMEALLMECAEKLLAIKPQLHAHMPHCTTSQKLRFLQVMARFSEALGQELDLEQIADDLRQ